MAEGDLILSNGTAISPEDIRLIASEAKKILASESREIMEYEEVFSLSRISSFPAVYQQGTSFKLVRIAMNLLKGLDGKNVELMSTSESVLWRKEGDSDWKILTSLSSLKGDKGVPGEPVILRKSEAGIDWKLKNEPDSSWQNIVNIDDIKLKYSDLSSSDKSELTKIPVLDDVSAKKGSEPSGEFNFVGLDDKGNPQYRLNLTLPKGDSGLPPQIEIGSVETSLPDTFAEVSLTESGVSEEGRPVYMINFKIPAGRPGQDGNGAGNVYVKTDNIQSGHNYVFQAGANNSANGTFVEIGDIELGVGKTYPDTVNGEIFNDYENNIALGKYSHAEGSGKTATFKVKTFVHSDIKVGYYDYDTALFKPQIGDLHLIDGKVYRILDVDYNAGIVTSEGEFDMINIIYFEEVTFDNSVTEIVILFNSAYGNASHREGMYTNSVGESSHAEGKYTNSVGESSHAEGRETISQGQRSHSEGYQTKAIGSESHAEGRETISYGPHCHVEGMYGISYGPLSHVEGVAAQIEDGTYTLPEEGRKPILSDVSTVRNLLNEYGAVSYEEILISNKLFNDYYIHGSFGERNHVEGVNNISFSNCSHIEGSSNISGDSLIRHGELYKDHIVHIEGCWNKAYPRNYDATFHLEGKNNKILEDLENPSTATHVEGGYNTIDCSKYSHVGGYNCKSEYSNYSFAHGYYLSVKNTYEVAFGKFNASEVGGKQVLFSYGVGTSDTNRKNAISVFSDGSVEIPKLISSTEGLDEEVEQLEKIISDNYTALSSKITGILNLLSTDNIDKKVFVVADSLVITYKVDANVEGDTLIINDYDFSVEGDNLIYESIVRAYVTDNNLFITDFIDAKVDESELIIQDEKINVVNNNLNII